MDSVFGRNNSPLAWKPKWASQETQKLSSAVSKSLVLSPTSPLKSFGSAPCLNSLKMQSETCEFWITNNGNCGPCYTSQLNEGRSSIVTEGDLKHLWQLVELRDGGPTWIDMIDRSTPYMSYQAWRRDPKTGPPQYCTKTVFEDASTKTVRDFFWDDVFRSKWDDMVAYSATIEECPTTGTMALQWIKKLPLPCGDKEYIIG